MSNRNISENLEYFVDNEGLHYNAPFVDITTTDTSTVDGNFNLTGTWTLGGTALTTGTVTSSSTINVGSSPGRILTAIYPKSAKYNLAGIALTANTPLMIDWTAKTNLEESFTTGISIGNASTHVAPIGGTPTQWGFLTTGEWAWQFSVFPTVNLGDNQSIRLECFKSTDSGGSFPSYQMNQVTKGGIGTYDVGAFGGNMCHTLVSTAANTERMRFEICCSENKTVDMKLNWIFLKSTA